MMRERVLEFIRRHEMIVPGDVCLVGLSGGADSVCLLLLLRELKEELGCGILAVHVNHEIRGEEARRDEVFSGELCERLGIPFFVYSYPVERLAAEQRLGTEEMGRLVRKEAFSDCMRAHGGTKLALAHHQNDLAETFLFHLARGTSLTGLAAIRPVRGNVIRPLLCMNREEIEHYVKENQGTFCQDSTNFGDGYTRNKIRHHVLSYLSEEVNPGTVGHIAAVSEDLREVCDYLDVQTEEKFAQYGRVDPSGECVLLDQTLCRELPLLQRTVILKSMETAAGRRKDLTREHVERVRGLLRSTVGKAVSLPCGMTARRTYEGVKITVQACTVKPGQGRESPEERICPLVENDTTQFLGYTIGTKILPRAGERIPEKTYTKWFDYDKIKQNAVFRTRRSGDYLVINASGGRKKLKDYLIDAKVPRESRDNLMVLASGSEVFWVIGYRMGESAKVSEDTRQMIQIHITGGNTNE